MKKQIDRLKKELKKAVSKHFKKLTQEVPDIYGYAIFAEDGVSSLAPVANRKSTIKVKSSDRMYNYYRFIAVEWSESDDFGLFEKVNEVVNEILSDEAVEFPEKREAILRASLSVLVDLESEGLFGSKTNDRFLVICLSDSDEPIMMESAKLLNTSKAFKAYAAEF